MDLTPESRVVVVTGAGSGIGRAVAVALQRRGHRVLLAGRRADALRESVVADAAGESAVVPTDVTDPAAVQALFAAGRERWGRIDVLFNNAGSFGPGGSIDAVALADWQAVVSVNLTGAFLCAREAFRVMKAQDPGGGRIINNGSISAQVPRPHSVGYAATKHGLAGLTKAVALDGRAHGILCGQIDIGNAATELAAQFGEAESLQADGSRRSEPLMDVERAARSVVFLAELPPDAHVPLLTVVATGMPFDGRG